MKATFNIQPSTESSAYMTFVINVHDWIHTDESADILMKLVDLFEKYNVPVLAGAVATTAAQAFAASHAAYDQATTIRQAADRCEAQLQKVAP